MFLTERNWTWNRDELSRLVMCSPEMLATRSLQAASVLALLYSYAGSQDGLCWPSARLLAEKLGIQRERVAETLKRLVKHGLIERVGPLHAQEGMKRATIVYRLLVPPSLRVPSNVIPFPVQED